MASIYIYPPIQVTVETGDLATAAKQDEQTALLTTIESNQDAQTVILQQIEDNTDGLEALATAGNASLSSMDTSLNDVETAVESIDTKTPALVGGSVPVVGPLTDTELRATAVPVSGPLTDVQLRATPVPVSGPLTDAQLRAVAVPVSMASAPLPTGAATEATLASIDGKITEVDTSDVTISSSVLPTGAATSAKQDTMIASLDILDSVDYATQTTLAALNTKVSTVDTDDVTITSSVLPAGAATSAKQDTMIASLDILDSVDYATETTLAALNAKVTEVDTSDVTISASALPTGAATETSLDSVNTKLGRLAGSLTNVQHDYIAVTYVAAGNGVGEIETVVLKTGGSGGSTVATLTLAYNSDNKLTSVTRS